MKKTSYALLCILSTSLLFAGCTKTEPAPESSIKPVVSATTTEEAVTVILCSATVDNREKETKVTYTFKNQSKETITVIGGASYSLLKNDIVIEKGAVPIKDYLDLEPGQSYTDSKIFTNLPKGEYLIDVFWNKTKVTARFSRN